MNRHIPAFFILLTLLIIYFTDKHFEAEVVFLLTVLLIVVDNHLSNIRKVLENE